MSDAQAPSTPRPLALAPVPRIYLGVKDLTAALGFSSPSSLYRLMEKDPTFPRPHRPILPTSWPKWPVREVEAWIEKKSQEAREAALETAAP